MNDAILTCQDERRRQKVRGNSLNGLDYVEVELFDDDGQPLQHPILVVYLLGKAPEQKIEPGNVRIEGGRRILGRDLRVISIEAQREDDPELDDSLIIIVDKSGDFSSYTLRLVELGADGRPTGQPFPGFDQRYSRLQFSFKADCPSDLDCQTQTVCPPEQRDEPEINYLAKDYASFRQLILDRLALVMPDWQERHVPDLGIALVEVLAYAGDHLSYYQDAVATEAYLETARQRISVRRHVRLVDYPMHEGCNARAWVSVETDSNLSVAPQDFFFITGHNDALAVSSSVLTLDDLQKIPSGRYEVFEPMADTDLQFRLRDLKDPAGLAVKLRGGRDNFSRYLQGQFSRETKQLLDNYTGSGLPPEPLQWALIGELNRLLGHENLYDKQRFAQVTLTEETRKLLEQNPRGEERTRLNRMLLEYAYPDDIAKSGKIYLYAKHNELHFYTWGDQDCCLPRGATTTTLHDEWEQVTTPPPQQQKPPKDSTPPAAGPSMPGRKLHLQVGDILIFEEVIGPKTGNPADADPTHRHAVRLTKVTPDEDKLYDPPVPIVEIEWAAEDALPFPLCISAVVPAPECPLVCDISVARGNVILVDHGQRIEDEPLGAAPGAPAPTHCEGAGQPSETMVVPGRFRPRLKKTPLTFSQLLSVNAPASRWLTQEPREALPQVKLSAIPAVLIEPESFTVLFQLSDLNDPTNLAVKLRAAKDPRSQFLRGLLSAETQQLLAGYPESAPPPAPLLRRLVAELTQLLGQWIPQRDLLSSTGQDRHFVAEVDNDGRAHPRFGDGELGQVPPAGSEFNATYRVGNGLAGNVGAEAISHIVFRQRLSGGIERVRNPLAAQGGIDPEPLAEVKLFAPHAFRSELQRAITADDYAELVKRDFKEKVQRAAAALRWTGSWYEAQVAIDPFGTEEASEALLGEIAGCLYRYRRMGHDLAVQPAHYVPLDIELTVCVKPHYLRGHIEAALLDLFSNRALPDGRRGFFHPDNLSFGEGIYLSKLVAAAQAVVGVESVEVNILQRRFERANHEIENGLLPLGPAEIAQLDNDPSFPERGRLALVMKGGR